MRSGAFKIVQYGSILPLFGNLGTKVRKNSEVCKSSITININSFFHFSLLQVL